MKRTVVALLVALGVWGALSPPNCPAPLVWRKGEGWTWEHTGVTIGSTPAEQLQIGRDQLAKKHYGNAVDAFRRLVKRWPTSAAIEEGRMGLAESLTALGYIFDAYREYQNLIEKNPNSPYFDEILEREFAIATRFRDGERLKRFGIRWFPAPEKGIEIYEQVVKNGPYSKVGPRAQFAVGATYVKEKDYLAGVKAYERLLERYPQDPLAEQAQFAIGEAYRAESKRAEYDQNAANQAITAYNEYLVRYPNSPRDAEVRHQFAELKLEQAHGLYQIGQFYEKRGHYQAAALYYNDVVAHNPQTTWAVSAQAKLVELSARLSAAPATSRAPAASPVPATNAAPATATP